MILILYSGKVIEGCKLLICKYHSFDEIFKNLLFQNHWSNLTKLGTKHLRVKMTWCFTTKDHSILKKRDNGSFLPLKALCITHVFIDLNWFPRWAMWPLVSLPFNSDMSSIHMLAYENTFGIRLHKHIHV